MYSLHTQTLLSRGDVLVFYNFLWKMLYGVDFYDAKIDILFIMAIKLGYFF